MRNWSNCNKANSQPQTGACLTISLLAIVASTNLRKNNLIPQDTDYLAANLLLARILAPKKYRAKMPPTQEACEEDLYHVSLELELIRTND